MAKNSERISVPTIIGDVDLVDMGDGTSVLDITLLGPLRLMVRGKSGGFIMMAGQVVFTPIDGPTATRLRHMLFSLPGLPTDRGKLQLVTEEGELFDPREVEQAPF